MFNYNHLYYFYVTAKSGGISSGAKFLKIAQPSLSAQLKTLEKTLELKLFIKVGRNVELSPEGKTVYSYCSSMFEFARDLNDYLKKNDRHVRDKIRIGVSSEIERPFIADLIGNIIKQRTSAQPPLITLTSSTHDELYEKLKVHEIDYIFSNRPTYGDGTTVLASIEIPVGLIVSSKDFKKHSFTHHTSLKDFFKEYAGSLALPASALKLRQEIDIYCHKNKIRRETVFESDMLSSVNRAIIEGVGFGFSPLPYVQKEIEQKKIYVIGAEKRLWSHNLTLLTLSGKRGSEISNHLKNSLLKIESLGL